MLPKYLTMSVLFFVTLGTLLHEGVESKCETLLMCPTFCMKVQNGCYVCDCGTFSSYLQQASDKMSEKSNTQQQQTGTRLSSYTSGYGIPGNENEMLRSNNDQRVHDYKNMMELGLQFMNIQSRPLVRQHNGIANPGLMNYGQSYQNMPGMNCAPVDTRCPSSCWSTNVYTGCVHCACENHLHNGQNVKSTKRPKIPEQQTPAAHFDNLNHKNYSGNSWYTTTTVSSIEQVPISISKDKPKTEYISTTKPDVLQNTYFIKVPTRPATQRIQEGVYNIPYIPFPNVASDGNKTWHSDNILIPTLPPQKVNESFEPTPPTYNRNLNIFETRPSWNENKSYKPETTIHPTVGYPTPALIPEIDQFSAKVPYWEQKPEHEGVNLVHNFGTTIQQAGNKSQEFTNISNVIDLLRYNTANFIMDKKQQMKQQETSSILHTPRTPLTTVKENSNQATASHVEQFLEKQSLPFTGHGDYTISNTSSRAMVNHLGFYSHTETG